MDNEKKVWFIDKGNKPTNPYISDKDPRPEPLDQERIKTIYYRLRNLKPKSFLNKQDDITGNPINSVKELEYWRDMYNDLDNPYIVRQTEDIQHLKNFMNQKIEEIYGVELERIKESKTMKNIKKAQFDDEMREQLEDLGMLEDAPDWIDYEDSDGSGGTTDDYIVLSSVPIEEECEQLGPTYDPIKAQKELEVFKNQLERQFPKDGDFPGKLEIKYFDHDFGRYGEVVAHFDSNNEKSINWAFNIENELPLYWDEIAKKQLENIKESKTMKNVKKAKESKTMKNVKIAKVINNHMSGKKTIASKKVMNKIASKLKENGFKAPFKIEEVKTATSNKNNEKKNMKIRIKKDFQYLPGLFSPKQGDIFDVEILHHNNGLYSFKTSNGDIIEGLSEEYFDDITN